MASSRGRALALSAAGGILAGIGGCTAAALAPSSPVQMPEYPPAPSAKGEGSAAAVEAKHAPRAELGAREEATSAAGKGQKDCCAGKNDCKGKGNCKTAKNACKGMNQCKGQGGCKSAPCTCPPGDPLCP